jgi:hypothetical protein
MISIYFLGAMELSTIRFLVTLVPFEVMFASRRHEIRAAAGLVIIDLERARVIPSPGRLGRPLRGRSSDNSSEPPVQVNGRQTPELPHANRDGAADDEWIGGLGVC